MEIEINGQIKQLKELKYLDVVEVSELREKEGLRAGTKKYLVLSGLTEEEVENLSLQDGIKIQKEIEKIKEYFQNPTEELKPN